ncbi:hypothetical protein EDE12_11276 [Methylosinus sp. sav-2]|uniref:hypothetical protein n=1 Tax=Methylosinus sp. sav-2 TaxID=2485168 RepID=UPI00047BFC19|nr:hypothetical protein [Methylosinus sp. sav-2]TDX61974.1 hypothetical protein EDE12_11276 [Methylosinus sp. sav-2]
MTDPRTQALADKYIGRAGGAPEPSARIKSPSRVGGVFLGPQEMRHVATLFEFSETIVTQGQRAFPRGGMRDRASIAQKALADLLGVPESDLRSAVALYLKQNRP